MTAARKYPDARCVGGPAAGVKPRTAGPARRPLGLVVGGDVDHHRRGRAVAAVPGRSAGDGAVRPPAAGRQLRPRPRCTQPPTERDAAARWSGEESPARGGAPSGQATRNAPTIAASCGSVVRVSEPPSGRPRQSARPRPGRRRGGRRLTAPPGHVTARAQLAGGEIDDPHSLSGGRQAGQQPAASQLHVVGVGADRQHVAGPYHAPPSSQPSICIPDAPGRWRSRAAPQTPRPAATGAPGLRGAAPGACRRGAGRREGGTSARPGSRSRP